jgi:hypothetical protein
MTSCNSTKEGNQPRCSQDKQQTGCLQKERYRDGQRRKQRVLDRVPLAAQLFDDHFAQVHA